MAEIKLNKKPHRLRKNGRANELWQKYKKDRNSARPKQYWVGGSIAEGGHWEGR